jgi:D-amino-acid dehydrogenase
LGCSSGNAGIVATSEIFPIISPFRLLGLPRMLVDRDGPAAIRFAALPGLTPWVARAVATLSAKRQHEIIRGLAALNEQAVPAWRDLLKLCGAPNLMAERGMLGLTRSSRAEPVLQATQAKLIDWGIPSRLLTSTEVRELEPSLNESVTGGILHERDAQVLNPLTVSKKLVERFRAEGGRILRERVDAIHPTDGGCHVRTEVGLHATKHVVVASGIDSAKLLAPLGIKAPLQAERGYHLDLHGESTLPDRPITFLEESCVATPMSGFLRLAGTVEFAGPNTPPTWHRAERLRGIAQRYFASALPESRGDRWMGRRPSLPDSLPAIGRLRAFSTIGYAFGHQHLGLTQAAISARLIADLITLGRSNMDDAPYAIERFASHRRDKQKIQPTLRPGGERANLAVSEPNENISSAADRCPGLSTLVEVSDDGLRRRAVTIRESDGYRHTSPRERRHRLRRPDQAAAQGSETHAPGAR